MAFNNQQTTLVIPDGATSGPRIVIDGDAGTVIVYGNTDQDFILIDPSGPDGKPIINFQDSDSPGDLLAGIQWTAASGLELRGWEYVEGVWGETVRAMLRVLEGAVELGFRETSAGNFVGGTVDLAESSALVAYKLHDGTNLSAVSLDADGISLSASDGSLVERFEYEGTNSTTGGGTAAYVAGAAHSIVFIAPRSGSVEIELQGWLGNNSATAGRRSYLSTQVREGSTIGAGVVVAATDDTIAGMKEQQVAVAGFKYGHVSVSRRIDGLTPGDTYHVRSMFRCDNAADTGAVFHRSMFVRPIVTAVGGSL